MNQTELDKINKLIYHRKRFKALLTILNKPHIKKNYDKYFVEIHDENLKGLYYISDEKLMETIRQCAISRIEEIDKELKEKYNWEDEEVEDGI